MKFLKSIFILMIAIVALSGCNLFSDEEPEGNLISTETLTEGSWIGFKGESHENNQYVHTEPIDYNPMNTYILNMNAYVSYYDDERFIKTIQHPGGNPISSESDANNLVISFNEDRIDKIEFARE